MKSNNTTTKLVSVLVTVSLIGSAIGGFMAFGVGTALAASADMTANSDLQGNGYTVNLEPGSSNTALTVEVENTSTDDVELQISSTDTDAVYYENIEHSASSGTYTWTLTHDTLSDKLPRVHTQDIQYNVAVVDQSTGDVLIEDTITVTPAASDWQTVKISTLSESSAAYDVDDYSMPYEGQGWLAPILPGDKSGGTQKVVRVGFDADIEPDTTVVVEYNEVTAQKSLQQTYDSSLTSKGKRLNVQLVADGDKHKVYYEYAPNSAESSGETYGVVTDADDDGSPEVVIHPGDSYDSKSSINVDKLETNQDYGILTQIKWAF